MKGPRMTSMSFDTLIGLRAEIDQLIRKRAAGEAKRVRQKLAELTGFGSGSIGSGKKVDGRKKRRTKAAIKYRGPKGETWSGRGRTPLWMTAYIKKGRKKESFLVK